jgi:ADP-heptose:LPS heptosyltransferase
MLTAAIRDLHKSYPGKFVTDLRTTCKDLWEHNPYCTKIEDDDPAAHYMYAEYPLINQSNTHPFHFIHGFTKHLEALLGVRIKPGEFRGDIHVADMEKRWYSQVYEKLQRQVPFWIIDAGHKMDYTAKHWDSTKYQAVVDSLPEITFVQVGAKGKNHNHPRLTGDNVVDLVGQTTLRQMVRLMYNAAGVITPVSFPMHLASAVEMHPWYKRKHRPCIVLAGGREPQVWEAYSNHQFLHTCGMLPCNSQGGCWKSRTVPVGDGDKKDTAGLCERPVKTEAGEIVPQCMDMISVEDVVKRVQGYVRHYDYSSEDPNNWGPRKYEGFPEEVKKLRAQAVNRTVTKALKS